MSFLVMISNIVTAFSLWLFLPPSQSHTVFLLGLGGGTIWTYLEARWPKPQNFRVPPHLRSKPLTALQEIIFGFGFIIMMLFIIFLVNLSDLSKDVFWPYKSSLIYFAGVSFIFAITFFIRARKLSSK
jgi:hypothetical protein